MEGTRSSVLSLIGFTTIIFNFTIVNVSSLDYPATLAYEAALRLSLNLRIISSRDSVA